MEQPTPARSRATVHATLGRYLRIDARAIEDRQILDRDLGLDPFDLVLVAFELVTVDPEHGPFPLALMQPAMTVGDLVAVHEAWSRREESWDSELPDTERSPETGPNSGGPGDRPSYI